MTSGNLTEKLKTKLINYMEINDYDADLAVNTRLEFIDLFPRRNKWVDSVTIQYILPRT